MLTRDFLPEQGVQPAKLSAILMVDSFVYCLMDDANNILGHKSHEGIRFHEPSATSVIMQDEWLHKSYKKVVVTALGGATYFVQDDLDAPIPSFPGLEGAVLLSDQFSAPNSSAIVYGITIHQCNLLQQLFNGNNMTMANVLLPLLSYTRNDFNTGIVVHFEQKNVCMLCVKEGKLKLFNVYEIDSPKDILYFALAAMKESGLTAGADKAVLTGWISQDSALFQSLAWYLKAEMVQTARLYQGGALMPEGVQPHAYFLHYCAASCAL